MVANELRATLRRFRHNPTLALAVVFILAASTSAVTATFAILKAAVLKPLPWVEPDRLTSIYAVFPDQRSRPGAAWNRGRLSFIAWDSLRADASFDSVAAWFDGRHTLGADRGDIVPVFSVSGNFFEVLGVRPALGRAFNRAEDDGPTDSAIVSYQTWRERFAERPDIVGQSVVLGDVPPGSTQRTYTIVGVGPVDFKFKGRTPEFFRPIGGAAQFGRTNPAESLYGLGRLHGTIGIQDAERSVQARLTSLAQGKPTSARVVSLVEDELGDRRMSMWILFGSALILLLVGCSNVGGLLLSDARARSEEFSLRAALGANSFEVVRGFAIESLSLSALGTVAGLWFGSTVLKVLPSLMSVSLPRELPVDTGVAFVAVASSALTVALFGVLPVILAVRKRTLSSAGMSQSRTATFSRSRGQRLIVTVQVAFTLILLVGAGLFAETMFRLSARPLGFDPDNVAVISTDFTGDRYGGRSAEVRAAMVEGGPKRFAEVDNSIRLQTATGRTARVIEALSRLPGVTSVGGVRDAPFASAVREATIRVGTESAAVRKAQWQVATAKYFQTMGMPIIKGRTFSAADEASAPVALVSKEFERQYLDENALGRQFSAGGTAYSVIGVVDDVRQQDPSDLELATFYAFDRQIEGVTHFVVRTALTPATVLPAIQKTVRSVSPQLVVTKATTMNAALGATLAERQFRAWFSGSFGTLALVLSAFGIYGLAARRAFERRREMGVRMALGASASDVRRLVIREYLALVAVGLATGLPVALLVSRVVRDLVFGVPTSAIHTFAIPAFVLCAVAVLATLAPAIKVSRLDPTAILRE